ncbi:PREDICTED: RUN and SH3 domain-containing protein 1, partial [Mesitornis unicolor]|uniref:RUN and SH3 domain-containing protein 1 n=1 Tax=Mesitornis unicolor TaxID=54374 RepID=UPI0005289899
AQLGDSRLSPDVGYLLLYTLCPALYALVEDGLKPFQKDVITGQRKNSPWSVVEASVKTGPSSRALHSLCWHVAGLAPLSSTRQKFHAFILGLLNIKQLELWISHLQKSPGVVSVLYSPTAFFALSQGPLPHLADELLLLIQPLSVLTFHLDLLFEHHHLSVDVRPLSRRLESPPSPAHHAAQARGALEPSQGGHSSAVDDELPPDALGRAAGAEGSARPQSLAVPGLAPGPQVGSALQQTFQHVLRRPSSWLSPSARVLAVVVKGLASEKSRNQEQPERSTANTSQTHRSVRALCDHTGTTDGHLSFQKGDILQLLSTVDEDWIRCCHGNSTGLVPVGYTSLIL